MKSLEGFCCSQRLMPLKILLHPKPQINWDLNEGVTIPLLFPNDRSPLSRTTNLSKIWKVTKNSVLAKVYQQHSPFRIQPGEHFCTLTLSWELTDEGTVGQSTSEVSSINLSFKWVFFNSELNFSQGVLLNTLCLGTKSNCLQCEAI